MANLQGKKISNTYEGLIKTENNSAVSGATVLTDGAGNSLQITVNTDGTLTAQTITAGNLNISNWDEAYSWGDHSIAGYATSSEIATAVNNVINSAPTALDTLDELAAALNDDANFAATITNLITGVSDRVTILENAGFITTDTNTQLSDADIAAMGYIKTDTNTQLTDAEIAAMGYIKVDTNTQRTDAEIDARIALNPQGFITSYVDTNTQLTDAEIAAMGYIKTDTQLTDAEIAALGYIKTDTNTQRTDAEIDARIALNPEGFITSYVDTNTQLSDADIAAMGYIKTDTNTQLTDSDIAAFGYIKTDTNTQRSDAEIDARIALNPEGFLTSETDSQTLTFTSATGDLTISNGNTVNIPDNNTQRTDAEINSLIDANTNGYITDYTVTEGDVTAHEAALTITESQISDLSHFSGSYNDLTDKPAGIIARSDEEIEDVIGSAISGSGATSVVYNDAAGTIVVSSTDTNTQLTDAEIAAFGYIKTDTNTQLTDSEIAAMGYIKVDTNTQLTDGEIAAFGYVKTDTQLTDSDIAAFGYIKTDTNTQRSDTEIQAIIDANSAGFITTFTDTNTQLSDADIAAMGYIKVDNNTQLSDSDIAAFGYVKTDTQLTDAEIAAFGYIKTDTNTQRTDTEIQAIIDANTAGFITTYVDTNTQLTDAEIAAMGYIKTDTNTQLSDADIAAFGYIKTDTNTQRTDAEIDARIALNPEGFVTTDTNTQLSDAEIAAFGYIKTDTNTQRTDTEINALIDANSNGYITDYTVTEGDVTAHQGALSITESQISDLSHFSGSYNDLTDKPTGITARTDEEIQDVIGGIVSGGGATTVTYNDVANTITISSTDTNTQLTDAQIAALGYIKTDTNTQRTDAEIDARIALNPESFLTDLPNAGIGANTYGSDLNGTKIDTITIDSKGRVTGITTGVTGAVSATSTQTFTNKSGNISQWTNDSGYVTTDTNTQLSDADITAMGYIKTDTNTQRTDAEIDARIALNPEGFVTSSGNTIIGTDTDINTSGATIIDNIFVTDGVITSMGTRTMTASDISALPISGGNLTGNLGINESSASTKLHVTKNANSHAWSHNTNALATFENSASTYLNIVSGSSNQGELWFSDSDLSGIGRLRYDHSSNAMEIWAAAGPKAYFYSSGNVTITGNLSENSDIKLKENINDIDNALDKVNSLRGVEYNMIADESKTKKIGFIAQEVEEVVPEIVFDNGDVKSVAYSNTVALLVEAVKELTDKVNDLQGQIDAMRA